MKLNAEQLEQRKEILKVMVKNHRERRPWLSLKETAEEVACNLSHDPVKLQIINALAASTTRKELHNE